MMVPEHKLKHGLQSDVGHLNFILRAGPTGNAGPYSNFAQVVAGPNEFLIKFYQYDISSIDADQKTIDAKEVGEIYMNPQTFENLIRAMSDQLDNFKAKKMGTAEPSDEDAEAPAEPTS